MNRSVLLRNRKLVVLCLAIPALLVATVSSGVATASAAYPVLTASGDCSAHVTFTASAWNDNGATDDTRTNNSVDIQYSTDGSQGTFTSIRGPLAGTPSGDGKYAFTKSNNFTFTDNFILPSSVVRPVTITLRAVALDKWGVNQDQDITNEMQNIALNVPGSCAQPAAVVAQATCAVPTAQLALRNDGGQDVLFHLYKNGADQPFETDSVGGNSTNNVTLDASSAYALSIHADNMAEVNTQIMPANCNGSTSSTSTSTSTTSTTADPNTGKSGDAKSSTTTTAIPVIAASVASNSCGTDAQSWSLTFDNTKSIRPESFVVTDNLGNAVDSMTVDPGKTLDVRYAFTAVKGTALSVTVNGKTLTTTDVKLTCVNASASIGTTCDTAGSHGALLGFTNTGKVDETFAVWRDGKPVQGSPFTISPSSLITWKLLPLDVGQTADMTVTGNDGFSLEKTITLLCPAGAAGSSTPPSVLAKTITRSGLAFTGIDLTPLVTFAIVMFALGLGLLYTSANLGVMSTLGGAKTETSGIRFDPALKATFDRSRVWFNELVAPKGNHARRRR